MTLNCFLKNQFMRSEIQSLVVDSDFWTVLSVYSNHPEGGFKVASCVWPRWCWPLQAPACWPCGRWGLRLSEASAETDHPLPAWGSGTPRAARASLNYKHSYTLIRHALTYMGYKLWPCCTYLFSRYCLATQANQISRGKTHFFLTIWHDVTCYVI